MSRLVSNTKELRELIETYKIRTGWYDKPENQYTIAVDKGLITSRYKNLTGKTFNRLTVLGLNKVVTKTPSSGNSYVRLYWSCRCICGTEKSVAGNCLTQNFVKSCGCLHKEMVSKSLSNRRFKHGKSSCPIYTIWKNAKCNSGVCEQWKEFENFYKFHRDKYEVGNKLVRINTKESFSPSNFKWISYKISLNGVNFNTLSALSRELSIHHSHLQKQKKKYPKLTIEEILDQFFPEQYSKWLEENQDIIENEFDITEEDLLEYKLKKSVMNSLLK